MKVLIEESFRLRNRTILPPHMSEWVEYHNQNIIDDEEIDYGIADFQQWVTIAYSEPRSNWKECEQVMWHDPNSMTPKLVEIIKIENGKITGLIENKERVECYTKDCEMPELIRRIADIDDKNVVDTPELLDHSIINSYGIPAQLVQDINKSVRNKIIRHKLSCVNLLECAEKHARRIFNIPQHIDDVGLILPWNHSQVLNAVMVVNCEMHYICDKYNYNLFEEWDSWEKVINKDMSAIFKNKLYFESINPAITAMFLI